MFNATVLQDLVFFMFNANVLQDLVMFMFNANVLQDRGANRFYQSKHWIGLRNNPRVHFEGSGEIVFKFHNLFFVFAIIKLHFNILRTRNVWYKCYLFPVTQKMTHFLIYQDTKKDIFRKFSVENYRL